MFKKLNRKKNLIFLNLFTVFSVTAVVFTTSCASNNPYIGLKIGDNIVVSNKKDAKKLKGIAESKIICASNPSVPTNDQLFECLVGPIPANYNAYASSQIYWEIAYFLSENWSKGHNQTLTFTGDFPDSTTGNKTFVIVDDVNKKVTTFGGTNDLNITINNDSALWAIGKNNNTGTEWKYEKGLGDSLYKLVLSTNHSFDSYACKIWD